ncbi:MAG: hypothetical protein HY472_00865 [Candidatus Sungbacteria bacterium]|nr:hypothetical protein [Candidatus Sungbacteria bacterium]
MRRAHIFQYATPLEHYAAEAFVVRCFDDRFWKAYKNFLKSLGFTHIDPESVAGGAKIFSSPEKESDRDFMLREIEKSIRLHHAKKVMLFTHHDCGAYGGFSRFNNDRDAEFTFHTSEHEKAAEIIRKRFPDLSVESYFIDDAGVIQIL